MATSRRKQRSGVEDLWFRQVKDPSTGVVSAVPTKLNGMGSRWRARYVDDQGQERTRRFARKADAQKWLNGIVSELVTGTYVDPDRSGVTFGTVAEQWIATKAARSPKTVAGYRSLLDTQVLPRWKAATLREIHFEDAQEWVLELRDAGRKRDGKGLSASRVVQAFQVFDWVLGYAVKARRLAFNPADGVELPRKAIPEKEFLTVDELGALVDESGDYSTLTLTLGTTGIRFGEAAALTWDRVDLTRMRLHISRSAGHVTGQGIVTGPVKNHQDRSVPIGSSAAAALRQIRPKNPGAGLVFPSLQRDGTMPLDEYRWRFDKAATAIGRPGITPHCLRHTAASLAIRAGANVKVVQQMLGHKTATMTLDVYGHLFPDDLDSVASALDAAYRLRTEREKSGTRVLKLVQ